MSDWKVIQAIEATNKVLNPSAEIAGNFAAVGGGAVSRVTTYQKFGLYSYYLNLAGDNEGISLSLPGAPGLPNNNHIIFLYALNAGGGVGVDLGTTWDWSLDNITYASPTLVMGIDATWDLYQMAVSNADAAGGTALYIRQNGATAVEVYIDAIVVIVGQGTVYQTYLDGDQPGCEWQGADHASVSYRPNSARMGGQVNDLQDFYGFDIEAMLSHGAAQHEQSLDRFALLPGASMNSDKLAPRYFTLSGVIRGVATGSYTAQERLHLIKYALVRLFTPRGFPKTADGLQPFRMWYTGATTVKEIEVFYAGGLEGKQSARTDPCNWERVALRFIAPDPLWHEIGNHATVLDVSDNANFKAIAWKQYTQDPDIGGVWNNMGVSALTGNDDVLAIAVGPDRNVYVGGDFTLIDGVPNTGYIAMYDPETDVWSELNGGLNGVVRGLAFGPDGSLYVVGFFTAAGGLPAADYVAMWDGTNWNAVGDPDSGGATMNNVNCVVVDKNGYVFVGGDFTTIDGIANASYAAYWDGATWTALQANPLAGGGPEVHAMALAPNGDVYIGGNFTQHTNPTDANYIVRYDGSAYNMLGRTESASGNGTNNDVRAIAVDRSGVVYLGGDFTTARGDTVNYIAEWNGTSFKALGNGVGAAVHALALGPDDTLWVGGAFTSMTDLNWVDALARWKEESWAPADIDFPASTVVYALAIGEPDAVVPAQYDVFVGFDREGTCTYSGDVSVVNLGTWPVFPRLIVDRSGGTSPYIISLHDTRTGLELISDYAIQDGERLTVDLSPSRKSVVSGFYGSVPEAILPNSDFGRFAFGVYASGSAITGVRFFAVEDGATITAWVEHQDAFESVD
jgi:hypothetical protein